MTKRSYKPERIIKANGIHTFFIGKPDAALTQCFESFCHLHRLTFSAGVRSIVNAYFVKIGLIDKSGDLTDKFAKYQSDAENARLQQLIELNKNKPAKKVASVKDDDLDVELVLLE